MFPERFCMSPYLHMLAALSDSPRIYVNSNPLASRQSFVTVADTLEEIEKLLTGLHEAPLITAEQLAGPFAEAANGRKKKLKEKRKRGRALLIDNEQNLYAHLRDVVIQSLNTPESPYFQRLEKLYTRRTNLVKKVLRDSRQEILAAQRQADVEMGLVRGSTRLRRGARVPTSYNEIARDQEIEARIRESEREARKRRRSSSDESEDSYDDDDEQQKRGRSVGSNSDGTHNSDDDDDDEDGDEGLARRSRRRHKQVEPIRTVIPGERRSARQQLRPQQQQQVREPSPPPSPEVVSRKASIIRSYSPDLESDVNEAPFGGLEEVWSMGRYRGYFRPDRTFIKAMPGDIPLYKLAKMGLPLPPLTGPIPGTAGTAPHPKMNGHKNNSNANGNGNASRTSNGNGNASGNSNTTMEVEDLSIPGSAVPTLEAETDDRETDDSVMMAEDRDDEDDDPGSPPIVVTSKRFSDGFVTQPKVGEERLSSSSKPSSRNTSHIQVVV